MVLQYSFVVFPQPGASRYVFYASSQCPNWPHILPLFIWWLNKHTKNIFSSLSSSLKCFQTFSPNIVFKSFVWQHKFGSWNTAWPEEDWRFSDSQVGRGTQLSNVCKNWRWLISTCQGIWGEKFLALAGALGEAKVEVFICYRFFELWHNLLLPTHWLSSLLKFQAIMVLSNLSFRCLKSKCLVGWIWLDISDQIDVVDNFTPTNEDNLTRCCGLTLSVWSWKLCLTLYWRQRPVCVKKTIGQGGNLLMSRKEKFRKSWKAIVHRCFPNSPSQESKATSMTKNGSKWWKDWGEGGCQPGRLGNPFGGAGRSSWILLSRFPPTFSDWTLFKFLNLRVVSHFWRCTLTGPDPALRWQPSLPRWRWAKGKAIS